MADIIDPQPIPIEQALKSAGVSDTYITEFMNHYRDLAVKMKIDANTPVFVYSSDNTTFYAKEGLNNKAISLLERIPLLSEHEDDGSYFVVNNGALNMIIDSARQKKPAYKVLDAMAHEMDHLFHHDNSPDTLKATLHNNPLQRAIEQRADIESSIVTCDPNGLAAEFQDVLDTLRKFVDAKTPHATDADFRHFISSIPDDHPSHEQRIEYLNELNKHLVKNPDGSCAIDHAYEIVLAQVRARAKVPDEHTL